MYEYPVTFEAYSVNEMANYLKNRGQRKLMQHKKKNNSISRRTKQTNTDMTLQTVSHIVQDKDE